MQNKDCVIVVHPTTQHSYQTALAVQKADLLKNFYTCVYYKPRKFPFFIFENLPFGIGKKIVNLLKRRYLPELDIEKIITYPFGEIVCLICDRVPFFKKYLFRVLSWRNKRFFSIIARKISKEHCKAVICYDNIALRIFEKAKKEGILCILDHTTCHYRTIARIFKEEAGLHPEFADSIIPPPEEPIKQYEKEFEFADYICVGSEFCKNSLSENGVGISKIHIIPYGCDIERFSLKPKNITDNIFRILFVGVICQRKGIKYLLEAFKQLQLRNCELILVGYITGSGKGLIPYRDFFTHIPRVSHYDVDKYFQKADIFVFPTLLEGSAIVTYEALASGLPVITTPNAGSVVRDGIDGFIVPIRDIEALKEKILLLYENRKLCQKLGYNARERAKEFTWEKYQQRLGHFLKSILAQENIL